MDFSLHSVVILWCVVAGICVILGLVLTFARQPTQKQPSAGKAFRQQAARAESLFLSASSSPRGRQCAACQQLTDDPDACFCWSCGTSLALSKTTLPRLADTTILVDEQALSRELQQARRARWK